MTQVRIGDSLPDYEIAAASPEKMKTMSALMRDANPIHFDADAVRALGMGSRTINQGPLNQAYVLSMLGRWAGGVERVQAVRLRYRGNVFAGERLRAGGTVSNVRRDGVETVAECDVRLDVLDGDGASAGGVRTVLSGTATVRMGARDHS